MSEKDIKTKPQGSPKVKNVPKVAEHGKQAVKDVKAVTKDILIKNTVQRVNEPKQAEISDRAEVQATENVESAAYATADTVYHKSKTFAENKIKQHSKKVKEQKANEPKTTNPQPKTPESVSQEQPKTPDSAPQSSQTYSTVKTKENYLKAENKTASAEVKPEIKVKTKENYMQSMRAENKGNITADNSVKINQKSAIQPKVKQTPSSVPPPKTPKQARQEYVSKKLKTKAEYERINVEKSAELQNSAEPTLHHNSEPLQNTANSSNIPKDKQLMSADKAELPANDRAKSPVKTKDSYMRNLRAERSEPVQSPYIRITSPKSKTQTISRSTGNKSKAVKTKQSISKANKAVKSGNVYSSANTARKSAQKTKRAKKAVKTQKEVTKKAAKEAAKQAKIAAQKAAQAAKAVAVKTAKAVVAISKAIVAAVTKAAAAFFAAFGWIGVVVVLVILIVVIIVSAIAGSPFGIFLSDEAADANSIPVSSIVNECNIELSARLTEIEDNTTHNRVVMEGEQADWQLILSLFSVKVAGVDDDTVQDVVVIDDAKKQKLKQVFWDMHTITSRTETVTNGETTETVLYITINTKTKDQMISQYGFTRKQKEALETLLQNADGFIGATQSLAISDATAQEVIDKLPDSLSNERKQVVKKACSLVGKLTYFWGGKSSAMGWDSEWGKMKLVTAEGSRSSGTMRPFGLDCSGFVTWSFINAGYNASAIGHGTSGQIAKCTRISWSEAKPGDLAFYSDLSHVGIVAGRDASGNVLVIHCSSGANNVVITTGGFGFAARPSCY